MHGLYHKNLLIILIALIAYDISNQIIKYILKNKHTMYDYSDVLIKRRET